MNKIKNVTIKYFFFEIVSDEIKSTIVIATTKRLNTPPRFVVFLYKTNANTYLLKFDLYDHMLFLGWGETN